MAKLRGKEKEKFLKRMAAGRRKAAANPRRKKAGPPRKKKRTKRAAKRKAANPKKKRRNMLTMPHPSSNATRNGKRRPAKKKNAKRKRRNPDTMDAAETMFEQFHGKRPERAVEYEQTYHYPENYAELGRLIELRFFLDEDNPDFPLTKFEDGKEPCQVVCTPDGSSIYFIGGDQEVDFEALDIASDKDFVELGPCTYICYLTVKGFHDFEPIRYYHEFGEENDILPTLMYDRRNKTLFLASGDYRVKPEGIVN